MGLFTQGFTLLDVGYNHSILLGFLIIFILATNFLVQAFLSNDFPIAHIKLHFHQISKNLNILFNIHIVVLLQLYIYSIHKENFEKKFKSNFCLAPIRQL